MLRQQFLLTRRRSFKGTIILLLSFLVMGLAGVISAPAHAATPGQQATVTIDNVTVTITSAVSSGSIFTTTQPGNAAQQAIAVSYNPYHSFFIEAIPYGSSGEEEGLPPAQAGSAPTYRSLLAKGWQQTQAVQVAPSITIFGQSIAGNLYHVNTLLDSLTAEPAIVEEWVAEAGSRIWIVRIIQAQTADFSLANLNAQVQGTTLTSTALSQPTTLNTGQTTKKPSVHVAASSNNPPWWNGTLCDTANHPTAYALGNAGLNGVVPCGPRPAYDPDSYGNLLVNFYSGAWGQLEWQCVELSMRYMYMVYGINPYPANGNEVVGSYNNSSGFSQYNSGNPNVSKLQTYASKSNQVGPISAGDILSWNTDKPAGHTSVVQSVSLDGNGNGSITTMEENGSSNGNFTYPVSSWIVNTEGYGTILGWLHNSNSGGTTPPPAKNVAVGQSQNGHLEVLSGGSDNNIWDMVQSSANSTSWNSSTPLKPNYAFNGDPAIGSWQGQLQAFARGTDNNIWHASQTGANGPWNGWTRLQNGYAFQGTPTVANDANGNIEVFARGSDNRIWHNVYSNGWSGWSRLFANSFNGDPAVGSWHGQLQVFARGTDDNIWHASQNGANGPWNGWTPLQNGYAFQGTPSVANDANGDIEVFAHGSDNRIWHNAYSNGWSGWSRLFADSFNGDPAVGSWQGQLQVFARGTDDNIWHASQSGANGPWAGWTVLQSGYAFQGTASVANDANGNIEVFSRGSDNHIWHNFYSNGWSGWSRL